jgi:7-cyano-7-deazaguanine reductase
MALKELDNSNISKHLGKSSAYASQYDPTLLVREPRSSNRVHLGIKEDKLPFVGYDTWNAYEISALTDSGLPVTGIIKLVYSCDNPYIVESKSIKLYFNSFNMTKMGPTINSVFENIKYYAERDLSDLLETQVSVAVYSSQEAFASGTSSPQEEWQSGYTTIDNLGEGVEFTVFKEEPGLIAFNLLSQRKKKHYKIHSSLLKSNCRVTSQPDFGDVYISFTSTLEPDYVSLLKYIVSFRDECHFHEEICETIFTRLNAFENVTDLHVMCLYTRRGGIDICPQRATGEDLLNYELCDPMRYHIKTPRQ